MIPPESHVIAEAAADMETAVAVAGATWPGVDRVAKGFPYVDRWARKGFMDELELAIKCVIESGHQPGLMHQLQRF